MSLMGHIAAQRYVGGLIPDINSAYSSDNVDSEVESADSVRSSSCDSSHSKTIGNHGKRNYDSTIHEARSEDERSSGSS